MGHMGPPRRPRPRPRPPRSPSIAPRRRVPLVAGVDLHGVPRIAQEVLQRQWAPMVRA